MSHGTTHEKTGYLPRPPTSPYRSQSLLAGWPPVCSSIFQVLLKSVQWFCRCGWSKIALPHYFGHWLIRTTACTTVQAVIAGTDRIRSIQSQFSDLITPDRSESTEVLKLLLICQQTESITLRVKYLKFCIKFLLNIIL